MAQQEVTARLEDYLLKQLDMYLGSITEDSEIVVPTYPKQTGNASALSQLNVGQLAFTELHTFNTDDDHFPIFHPNLVCLFSRVLEEGSTSCLTVEQERLWNQYIFWEKIRDVVEPEPDTPDPENPDTEKCECEPYVLPLMTTKVRGGAKLREGNTLGNVELNSKEGMYVDVTSLDEQITDLENKAAELNGETTA